ncbi:MAG: DUF3458 domain-containing protein, partial [Pseudomonadota bacterium]
MAHEYFHNWTGNRVTCRDWFQLSLKEGLTVFRDQEFSADQRSRDLKRIEDVQLLKMRQFPEDAGPFAHPVRPDEYSDMNNFYTVTVYEKGAEIVRMVHTLLGEEAFMQGMRYYIAAHDGKAATIEDFLSAMQQASDHDVMAFLQWYQQAGTPCVRVRHTHEDSMLTLHLTQSCRGEASLFPIPISLALIGADGTLQEIESKTPMQPCGDGKLFVMQDTSVSVQLHGVAERACVSLNRYFAAPIMIEYPQAHKDRAHIICFESDAVTRWQALQNLLHGLLQDALQAIRYNQVMPDTGTFLQAFWSVQDDALADKAFQAHALEIPTIAEMIDLSDEILVHDLVHVRVWLIAELAGSFATKLLQKHAKLQGGYDDDISAIAAGERALRNNILRLLCASGNEQALATAQAQADNAKNMTDHLAALAMLNEAQSDIRDPLMQNFYTRWCDDTIVIDKWISLQARSVRHCNVEKLYELQKDPAFSLTKPNRVQALLHGFCRGNPENFHTLAGYKMYEDMCKTLDAINP